MKEYSFTLKFNFPDARIDPDCYIEQLYEAGCDDALIGIGKQGCIALKFIRSRSVRFAESAASAFEAVSNAIVDVKKVIPDASLIEATPDIESELIRFPALDADLLRNKIEQFIDRCENTSERNP